MGSTAASVCSVAPLPPVPRLPLRPASSRCGLGRRTWSALHHRSRPGLVMAFPGETEQQRLARDEQVRLDSLPAMCKASCPPNIRSTLVARPSLPFVSVPPSIIQAHPKTHIQPCNIGVPEFCHAYSMNSSEGWDFGCDVHRPCSI